MLSKLDHQRAADSLIEAARSKIQAVQPSVTWPDITLRDAYEISRRVAEIKQANGGRIIGHKVGLTSKAMQRSSKIDEPDYGYIFSDMVSLNGTPLEFETFCLPRVEPELTFQLKDGLKGPNVTFLDVLEATQYVIPSIEIIDARVVEPRKIFDTVADNGAAAALILGGCPVRPHDIDLGKIGALMRRNGEIEETGLAAGVLGHPAEAVAWLANKLAEFDLVMEPGHLILSGSFTRPVFAEKGDTLSADFGVLGTVSVALI
ncbi:MAG: 2-oxopent-4-enoate hydratase [Sneathiellales bacterium]|nr:2-oxopent-4-enoate hydratase [Sneathiellales bacterium]